MWSRYLILSLIAVLSSQGPFAAGYVDKDAVLYLYDTDAGVIEDYTDIGNMEPPFFYPKTDEEDVARVVEIYAPWCPHCLKFRSHMVEMAGQMVDLAKASGHDEFKVHAFSCVAHKAFCRKHGIQGFPRLWVFKKGQTMATTNATQVNYWEVGPVDVLREAGINISNETAEAILPKRRIALKEWDQNRLTFFRSIDDVYNDAFLAFTYGLRTSLFDKEGSLEQGRRLIFRRWLILLSRAIPPHLTLHKLVDALLRLFSQVVHDEKYLIQVLDQVPPPRVTYSLSCTHGIKAAGYSCGLWELLHMVTVGAVEWNELTSDSDANEDEKYAAYIGLDDAGQVIRDYIDLFFACDVCRTHFVGMYDMCEYNRCDRLSDEALLLSDWQELPLWLLEVHNGVNSRLLREQADRQGRNLTKEEESAVIWPQKRLCSKCWYVDGAVNKKEMYKYLRESYWVPKKKESHELLKDRLESHEKSKERYHLKIRSRRDTEADQGRSILSIAWSPIVFFFVAGLAYAGNKYGRRTKTYKKL